MRSTYSFDNGNKFFIAHSEVLFAIVHKVFQILSGYCVQDFLTIPQLFFWLFIVVLIQILDYFIPMFGVKRLGGTPWGKWGCIIGTFAGIFLFAPWGVFIGPFVGAVVGELLGGKETKYALKAGFGAFAGFLLGTVLKVAVCGWFIFCFIRALV